ncbi:hypothetical protein C9374_012208 [Naegleria lovaniensis]|uniref:Tetratricopeptide repeat protein n=1 Tax=Naegleria lovaniensis TaxID=51637 RepID=A0AA88KHZ2_NAELO|nr:uncharacterized protein C9374_012208 [Naegleria lovaniensis]KAG2373342.1 hypothetical protein C9374_012208 [Naegleria lovaniensis]
MLSDTSFRDTVLLSSHTNILQLNNLGAECLQQGELESAISHFTQALQLVEHELLTMTNSPPKTKEPLKDYESERLSSLKSLAATCHCNLGSVYLNSQHITLALDHYNKALELKPDYSEAYGNRGLIYFRMLGDHVNVYNRGCVWRRLGEYEKAILDFTTAMEHEGNSSPQHAWLLRAGTYLDMNLYEQAIQDCDGIIEKFKTMEKESEQQNFDIVSVITVRGKALFASEQFLNALDDFERVVKMDPENVTAWTYLSKLYQQAHYFDLAFDVLCKISQLEGGASLQNLHERAICLQQLKQFDEAIRYFNSLLEYCQKIMLQENSEEMKHLYEMVLYRRGCCFIETGNHELALKDFEKVLMRETNMENLYPSRNGEEWREQALKMKMECEKQLRLNESEKP